MKKHLFKSLILLVINFFVTLPNGISQVIYTNGTELGNDKRAKMTRMIEGDDRSFYCYRSQTNRESNLFFVEKYNKPDLSPVFSKIINIPEDTLGARINDVQFASGTVFIFRQLYNKEAQKMTLFYQTVSSSGSVSNENREIASIDCDHYEFVNFDFFTNPGKTKFLIKVVHKRYPDDTYKTDFIIIDAVNFKKTGSRRVMQNLRTDGKQLVSYFGGFHDHRYGFSGLYFDDNDKIYYCVTHPVENGTDNPKRCKMSLYCLDIDGDPIQVDLPIGNNNYVRDVKILKTSNGEIEIAGFFHENIGLKGKKLLDCGLFSFKTDAVNNIVSHSFFSVFDDSTLIRLQSTQKKAEHFNYKLDHVISDDNSVYYIGEQYKEENAGLGWDYEYRDILLVRLNKASEFQWMKHIPLRSELRVNYRHLFKQYIVYATAKNIYVLFNDNPVKMKYYKDPEPNLEKVNPVEAIHGSDFVCNVISLKDGRLSRNSIFNNKTYCFAPIRDRRPKFVLTSDEVLYIPLNKNSIYIHTENSGSDKFDILTFE